MSQTPKYELPEIHFPTWAGFKVGFQEYLIYTARAPDAKYVFRGQSDAQWRLQSKFDRDMGRLSRNKAELRKDLLHEFRRQTDLANLSRPGANAEASNEQAREVREWALGQHYALPTPLLDWSDSPYVAAFFACQGAVERVSVSSRVEAAALRDRLAIFALRCDKAKIAIWKYIGVTLEKDDNPDNLRIRPQLGMFSLLKDGVPDLDQAIGQYCANHSCPTSDFVVKFTLPYSAAFDALIDLDAMDLSPRRIYADREGVSRAATLKLRLERLYGAL